MPGGETVFPGGGFGRSGVVSARKMFVKSTEAGRGQLGQLVLGAPFPGGEAVFEAVGAEARGLRDDLQAY